MTTAAIARYYSGLSPSGRPPTESGAVHKHASEELVASAAPLVASQPPVTRRRTSETASVAALPPATYPAPTRKRESETASAAPYPLRTRRLSDSSVAPPTSREVASNPPAKPVVPLSAGKLGKLDPINAVARGDFHHITPLGGKGERGMGRLLALKGALVSSPCLILL